VALGIALVRVVVAVRLVMIAVVVKVVTNAI
jgi:hypothetical protein